MHTYARWFAALLTGGAILTLPATAASSPTIAAEAGTKQYQAGDTVEIVIEISDNPGFVSLALIMEYDSEYFTLVGAEETNEKVFTGNKNDNLQKDPFGMYWTNDLIRQDITANGEIIKLTFEVKENIPTGDYTFGLSTIRDGILNFDIDNVDFDIQGETIHVTGTTQSSPSTETKPPEKDPPETNPPEKDPTDQNPDTKPSENNPTDTNPDTKPSDNNPTDTNPDTKPSDNNPTDAKPETKPSENDQTDANPSENAPDNDKTESRPDRTESDRDDSRETSASQNEPADTKPADTADESWDNPFYDVSESDSYYKAIGFVYENGLFNGMSAHMFAPQETMNRAMFVTVLGRLERVAETAYPGSDFADVLLDMWYTPYVKWASSYGIVQGYNKDRFGTTDNVTIEQAMVILARYASFAGIERSTAGTLKEYTDTREVSDWAREAVKWCIHEGIYQPERREINPKNPAPRWLVATMLYRFAVRYELEMD